MQFAVEAWDPDYGTGGDGDGLDPSTDIVDMSIEYEPDVWKPLGPSPEAENAALENTVYFLSLIHI